jgi:hypothetical protein
MLPCVLTCLRNRWGLLLFSIFIGVLGGLIGVTLIWAPIAVPLATLVLAAVAGGIGGGAITVTSCYNSCVRT